MAILLLQSGIFFGFIPFVVGWEIVFFDARGFFFVVSAEKNFGVFLVCARCVYSLLADTRFGFVRCFFLFSFFAQ